MKSRPGPKKKPTGDREWLYKELHNFIVTPDPYEAARGKPASPKTDRDIYTRFAPLSPSYGGDRPTWSKKNRKTKREMIKATLRRLIDDSKVRIAKAESLDLRNQHGFNRRNIAFRQNLFGKEFDGIIRFYEGTNVLQAMADALVKSDA